MVVAAISAAIAAAVLMKLIVFMTHPIVIDHSSRQPAGWFKGS